MLLTLQDEMWDFQGQGIAGGAGEKEKHLEKQPACSLSVRLEVIDLLGGKEAG